ncbi:MAG: cell division ATP-binding protein FtsE [Deltaproteobacteria bacterium]|nr:cell division ATP-binding protein FtsE [Deltaproteobacteria bacterium]
MIQLFHVTKIYQDSDAPALSDVSLSVEKSEFVFLTGPSGAGKTTLLRLLYGADVCTRGQILMAGRNLQNASRDVVTQVRRDVGVVFQDFKLIATRTVFDNVGLALEVRGLRRVEVETRVKAVLNEVGLIHRAHAMPRRLSGGEQQRVALARALVSNPRILICDEPTGNLDHALSLEVMGILEKAAMRGAAVVCATHDEGLLRQHKHRVLALDRGRLVSDRRGAFDRAADLVSG